MYKRILLAYDGSEPGQKALLDGKEIAQWGGAQVFLIAVMPPASALMGGEGYVYDPRLEKEEEQRFKNILAEGLRRLSTEGHAIRGEVVVGDAVDEITEYAKKTNVDLIVVGHKHLNSW